MPSDKEYIIVKKFITTITKICYRIEISGLEHFQNTKLPYIVAGNHHSTIDALMIGLFVPGRIHFLGKHSALWTNKVWAAINNYFGTIPVKDSPGSNNAAIEAGIKVLKGNRALGIFPEGAILPHRKAFEGKTGVARFTLQTGAPVIPIGILGTEDVLPYPEYGKPAVWPRIGRRVELHIRPPLYFSQYTLEQSNDPSIIRKVTDNIMKEIRIASKGYGCPISLLKDLIRQGTLTKKMLA